MSDPNPDEYQLSDLLLAWEERQDRGELVTAADVCADRPDLLPQLVAQIELLRKVWWVKDPSPVEPTAPQRPVQTVLAGRYRLDRLLGEGGFGQVWRGFDLELQRAVAVKVPRPGREYLAWEDAFLTEARKVAALCSPGVVPVYDVGRADGITFIVSELIEGTDLADRLRRGGMTAREAARVVADAARNLHPAHQLGFVHRDVKPANLLLGQDGRVLVTDFGIAVSADDPGVADRAGTPAYMAPEQWYPDLSRVDARADVYALGVVLYQAVTGRLPFPAASPAEARQRALSTEPPPPRSVSRSVPVDVERIIVRCLAKSPANRYPTAEALAADLDRWLALGPFGRTARAAWHVANLAVKSKRLVWGLGMFAASMILALAFVWPPKRFAGIDSFAPFEAQNRRSGPAPGQGESGGLGPDLTTVTLWREVQLFNGQDLTGWTIRRNTHTGWEKITADDAVIVRDGVLVLTGRGYHCIATEAAYDDFVLTLEYRYPNGGRHSITPGAVWLRVVNEPPAWAKDRNLMFPPADKGLAVTLDFQRPTLVQVKSRNEPPEVPEMSGTRPARSHEWKALEVRCVGAEIAAAINGWGGGNVKTEAQQAGVIELAPKDSTIEFRNIRLRPVKK